MSAEILGVLIARVSGTVAGDLPSRAHLRAARDEGHRVLCAGGEARPAADLLRDGFRHRQVVVLDEARGGYVARPPAFESGGGGLVSTVDDMLAFGQMMLNNGAYGRERILSRPSVELMTTDQITPEQKAASPFFEHFWDDARLGPRLGDGHRGATISPACPDASAGTAPSARPGGWTRRKS